MEEIVLVTPIQGAPGLILGHFADQTLPPSTGIINDNKTL